MYLPSGISRILNIRTGKNKYQIIEDCTGIFYFIHPHNISPGEYFYAKKKCDFQDNVSEYVRDFFLEGTKELFSDLLIAGIKEIEI